MKKKIWCAMLLLPFIALCGDQLRDYLPCDFMAVMADQEGFYKDGESARSYMEWRVSETLYNRALESEVDLSKAPRIPLIFHLIWLGSSVPERYVRLKAQIEEMHPGALVKVWTDREAKAYPLVNRRNFQKVRNYGAKSDILRYEILYNEGGIYLDGDFELLKPLTELCYAVDLFAGACCRATQLVVCNGLIGVAPGHPAILACIKAISASNLRGLSDMGLIMEKTGPYLFTRSVLASADDQEWITLICPFSFFYPWPYIAGRAFSEEERLIYLRPFSYAVHLWARSWQPGSENHNK